MSQTLSNTSWLDSLLETKRYIKTFPLSLTNQAAHWRRCLRWPGRNVEANSRPPEADVASPANLGESTSRGVFPKGDCSKLNGNSMKLQKKSFFLKDESLQDFFCFFKDFFSSSGVVFRIFFPQEAWWAVQLLVH